MIPKFKRKQHKAVRLKRAAIFIIGGLYHGY
nr:MAG TPA: hypothetical protein [Bacteriophage sp.]